VTIHLTTPISHATDSDVRLDQVGINFPNGRVMLRVTLLSTGEQRDFFVGNQSGDIDSIAGLTAIVGNFAGLRLALEQYLAQKVGLLAGQAS
jgi:hypothetical protein